MSVRMLTTSVNAKTGKKGEHFACFGCEQELDGNHLGIQCAQGHHLCMECSANLVGLFLAEPKIHLPPKCMICKVELNSSVFERQLSPYQYEKYANIMLDLLWSKQCLNPDEELIHCAFCSYAEIRVKSIGSQFMFCKHQDCRKTSCLICLHEMPVLDEEYDMDDSDDYEDNMQEIEKHFNCVRLKEAKKILDQAIENGQKVACPGCGLAGMKDDACTHMICPECQTSWCYFCGLKEFDCDKSELTENLDDTATPMYRHNTDWNKNSKRCPMFLTSIQDMDENWSDDEIECLEYFHRLRSLKFLRQAYEELGHDIFQQLNEQFGIIGACGFTLFDIKYANVTLIDYENRQDTWEESDSDANEVELLTADDDDDEATNTEWTPVNQV